MTDDATPTEPTAPALSPEVQEALDAIRAESAARAAAELATAQAEELRLAKINVAKQVCFDACLPIAQLAQEATDPDERAALLELELRTHLEHREALESAYLESSGQVSGDSNPVPEGGEGALVADLAVTGATEV